MDSGLTMLVDAASLIYRAFFSTPESVRTPDGSPMNATHGFLRMFARLIADWNPEHVCCAADDSWRPEWRVALIPSYKAERAEPESMQQQTERVLAGQVPVLFELLERCGVAVVGHADHEAEDVIGTLAARAAGPVAIVSGDRDLFQLVRDPDVFVLYPKRGVAVMDRVDEAYVSDRFGIPGRAYRDYAILRGDPSDGLPGVRGIGDKLARSLVARYGSLDAIVEAAGALGGGAVLGKVRGSLDYIARATVVTTIPTDLPIPEVDITRPRQGPPDEVYAWAEKYGLEREVGRVAGALESKKRDFPRRRPGPE